MAVIPRAGVARRLAMLRMMDELGSAIAEEVAGAVAEAGIATDDVARLRGRLRDRIRDEMCAWLARWDGR